MQLEQDNHVSLYIYIFNFIIDTLLTKKKGATQCVT